MSYGSTADPARVHPARAPTPPSPTPTPPDTREIASLLPRPLGDKEPGWVRHRLGGQDMVVSNLILTLATR
jgi:hypothetical protein